MAKDTEEAAPEYSGSGATPEQQALIDAHTGSAEQFMGLYKINNGLANNRLFKAYQAAGMIPNDLSQLSGPAPVAPDDWQSFGEHYTGTEGSTGGGTGGGGGGTGGGGGGGGGTLPPSTRDDLPQPSGNPVRKWHGENFQADTSWDWDAFAPKRQGDAAWGGYDTDYQAFERYQPGMESPWGMPDIEGGNDQFYQQQFVNMLRDEQGYQNRERTAQRRRQEAIANPLEAPEMDWSWANSGQGLKEVTPGTGEVASGGFNFNEEFAGMSLQDAFGQVQGKSVFDTSDSSKAMQDVLSNYFNDPNRTSYLGDTDFSSFNTPGEAFASINPESWAGMNRPNVAQEGLRTVINQMYSPTQQGAKTPVGYAAPI